MDSSKPDLNKTLKILEEFFEHDKDHQLFANNSIDNDWNVYGISLPDLLEGCRQKQFKRVLDHLENLFDDFWEQEAMKLTSQLRSEIRSDIQTRIQKTFKEKAWKKN